MGLKRWEVQDLIDSLFAGIHTCGVEIFLWRNYTFLKLEISCFNLRAPEESSSFSSGPIYLFVIRCKILLFLRSIFENKVVIGK